MLRSGLRLRQHLLGIRCYNIRKLKRLVKNTKGHYTCMNLGCGRALLNGWINIDINVFQKLDVFLDLTKGIPLPDGVVDFINTKDFIEHISLSEGTF